MRFSIIVLFLVTSFFQLAAQSGIEFSHGTWEETLVEAKAKDQLIFVDAYAVWCGPCKRMAKNVFTQKEVGDFFNKNFINMKIDMEKGMGLTFRKKYPVSAFPTLFFIDGNGEVVHKVKGAQQAASLIKLGKFAMGKVDYSKDFAKAYEEGDRSPELVYNYVKALNKSGKPSVKIANDYIRSQKDLTTDANLKFLLEATTEADSRIFDLMVKHKSAIEKLTSKEEVKAKIEKACYRTAEKALEFKSADLHQEAVAKMKKHYPEKAAEFGVKADMRFCLSCGEDKKYLKACEKYAKTNAKNDPEKLNRLAIDIADNFRKDGKAMKLAEKYAKQATAKSTSYGHFLTYANILLENGKKDEALKAAKKSLELAKGQKGPERTLQNFINKIEKG